MGIIKDANLGDPANNNQQFIDVKIKFLCCRYWLLDMWDCHDMVFPFWRVYWNRNSGGELRFQEKIYEMNPDLLYIITPFTSFSSRFTKHHVYNSGIHVTGKHMTPSLDEEIVEKNSLLHFFTHFNLGVPFDNVYPGIHTIELTPPLKERLIYLTDRLKIENKDFKITFNLKLRSFITETLSNMGPDLWKASHMDDRVLKAVRHIESNIDKKLHNSDLSSLVNMATNSFSRLFKEELNITLHNFIQNRKIAKACDLFEHTHYTIEEVAFQLGFSDRFHFSRVFKNITGITPGTYKSGKYT